MSDTEAPSWDRVPPGVWLRVVALLPVRQRFAASLVCKAWRGHVLSLCQNIDVDINSSHAARWFGVWLRAWGHQLSNLKISDPFFHHAQAPGATRIAPVDRIAMLQGLQHNGRPLPHLESLTLLLNELSAADAVLVGLCNMPALKRLQLDSNGSNIGVAGAQGLAPLTQLQQLVVPTQSLGDQALQILGGSLTNLRHINLHNDGHVTDDGLPALASLPLLTSLDLQGSISITNGGMAAIADGLPQLQELNVSWCASVEDWGMWKLCSLTGLTSLNLAATGVQLQSQAVLECLSQLQQLRVLRLDHCAVRQQQLAVLATALPGLQELGLSYSRAIESFAELRVLSELTALTKLDVSRPQGIKQPDAELSAVFELTQLRHLNVGYVVRHGGTRAAVAAATAGSNNAAAAAAAQPSAGTSWSNDRSALQQQFAQLAHMTELDLSSNLPEWRAGSEAASAYAGQCAALLMGLAAVQPQPAIQVLHVCPHNVPSGFREHEDARRFFDQMLGEVALCLAVQLWLRQAGQKQQALPAAAAAATRTAAAGKPAATAASGTGGSSSHSAGSSWRQEALSVLEAMGGFPEAGSSQQQQQPWLQGLVERVLAVGGEQQLSSSEAAAVVKLALPGIRRLQMRVGVIRYNGGIAGVGAIDWPA